MVEPSGSDDQIEALVAIDIAGGDVEAADWGVDVDHLLRASAELELDRVAGAGRADLTDLHGREIGPAVAIEVGNGEPGVGGC